MTATANDFAIESNRIDHKVIMVDSAMAQRWLERNTRNRKPRQVTISRYRSDMDAGRWTFAADPIRFSASGRLMDGQHRLMALAELDGVVVPMLVVRGLPDDAQMVMDQGSKRTPGDQLGLLGYKHSTSLAAAAKLVIAWEKGLLFRDNTVTGTLTSAAIEEWVAENASLVDTYLRHITITKQSDAPPSVAGAALIGFSRIDASSAIEFFTLLARGAGTEGHPIVTLDKRLSRIRRQGMKVSHRDYLAMFIVAWNAWREGRTITKLQRPRSGSWSEETFPTPH